MVFWNGSRPVKLKFRDKGEGCIQYTKESQARFCSWIRQGILKSLNFVLDVF